MSQRGFLSERKGKVVPRRGTEGRKGAGLTNQQWCQEYGGWEYQKQSGEYGTEYV